MKIQGTLTSWKLQSQLQPMTEEFDLPSLHTSHRVTPVDPVAQREEGREREDRAGKMDRPIHRPLSAGMA